VSLALEEGGKQRVAGQVRFLGPAKFRPGVWVGVELERPLGRNDGSVEGTRYFECKPGHGLFVHPNRLSKASEPIGRRASEERHHQSPVALPRLTTLAKGASPKGRGHSPSLALPPSSHLPLSALPKKEESPGEELRKRQAEYQEAKERLLREAAGSNEEELKQLDRALGRYERQLKRVALAQSEQNIDEGAMARRIERERASWEEERANLLERLERKSRQLLEQEEQAEGRALELRSLEEAQQIWRQQSDQ